MHCPLREIDLHTTPRESCRLAEMKTELCTQHQSQSCISMKKPNSSVSSTRLGVQFLLLAAYSQQETQFPSAQGSKNKLTLCRHSNCVRPRSLFICILHGKSETCGIYDCSFFPQLVRFFRFQRISEWSLYLFQLFNTSWRALPHLLWNWHD